MNRTFTKSNYQPKRKKLTDYAPEIALKRTRFYLDVMEAHFRELGAFLEEAKAQGLKTVPNPYRGKTITEPDDLESAENEEA